MSASIPFSTRNPPEPLFTSSISSAWRARSSGRKPAGVRRRLAVIGDAEVVVARFLASQRQLLDRVGSIRVAGVAVEKSS